MARSPYRWWTCAEIRRAQQLARQGVDASIIAKKLGRNTGLQVRAALQRAGTPWSTLRDDGRRQVVVRDLQAGVSLGVIARRLHITQGKVSRIAAELGIDTTARRNELIRTSQGRHALWASRWVDGETYHAIARTEGVSHQAVSEAVRKYQRRMGVRLVRYPQAAK
jgi:hypothetical protein